MIDLVLKASRKWQTRAVLMVAEIFNSVPRHSAMLRS